MKVMIEHEGHKATLEDESVVDICDAIDLIERALIKIGYAPKRVEGAFLVKAKQIEGTWE